jgi:hypothetical protein
MLIGAPMALVALLLKFPTGAYVLGDFGWYPYAIAAFGAGLACLGYRIDLAVARGHADSLRAVPAPGMRWNAAAWSGIVVPAAIALGAAYASPDYVLPLVYGSGTVCIAVLARASFRTGTWRHFWFMAPVPFNQAESVIGVASAVTMLVTVWVGWYRWT